MRYYTPDVTSWKQLCDLGVLLKDVLSFYQLDNDNQQLIKEKSSKFCRGSIGGHYGRPETLLDAANYVREECDKVCCYRDL